MEDYKFTFELENFIGISSSFEKLLADIATPPFSEEFLGSSTFQNYMGLRPVIDLAWLGDLQAAQNLLERQTAEPASGLQFLTGYSQADWEVIHQNVQKALRRGEHVGNLGWTITGMMTLPDVSKLSNLESTQDADAYMLDWYEGCDPELENNEKYILDSNDPSFHATISQCFSAFRHEHYALSVTALVPLVERNLRALGEPTPHPSTAMKTIVDKRKKASRKDFPDDDFMQSVVMSLRAFIHKIWESGSVNDHLPNRHVITHGIQAPPNNKIDAIRLVNTLNTIILCQEVDAKKSANPAAKPPYYT